MLAKCQEEKHGPRGILSLAARVSSGDGKNAIASQFDFLRIYPCQSRFPIRFDSFVRRDPIFSYGSMRREPVRTSRYLLVVVSRQGYPSRPLTIV